jgi:4-alpha-glucanotransferase
MSRHAGLLVPLFSATSTASWGIGELTDIVPLARWLSSAGFDRLMLLPLGPLAGGETSPYGACSAMAIDPVYIAPARLDDFALAGGETLLSADAARQLNLARASARVDYAAMRRAKREALDGAFARFVRDEWDRHTTRAAAFADYAARERWWLDDYALFQALTGAMGGTSWRAWPAPVRDRQPRALDQARRHLGRDVLRHQYWQWVAELQWQEARSAARAHGVRVIGDLAFAVGTDSADVWARPHEFMLDVSAGVPPDAFSPTGQDWGLPTYRWEVIATTGFAWIRQRARRMAALFDGIRVDHVVGLFRSYGRPRAGPAFFTPGQEAAQVHQGETILGVLGESGADLIAEDLGTVPDFVRETLTRFGVPGCRVLRWERNWDEAGEPFIDPGAYPPVSVAMTGTHDTETVASWWEHASTADRTALLALPFFRRRAHIGGGQVWTSALRDALLELVYRSASNQVLLPVQDVFGWRDRINTPATVGGDNWTWRLPWPVDRWSAVPEAVERAAFCHRLATKTSRGTRG